MQCDHELADRKLQKSRGGPLHIEMKRWTNTKRPPISDSLVLIRPLINQSQVVSCRLLLLCALCVHTFAPFVLTFSFNTKTAKVKTQRSQKYLRFNS